MASASCLFSDCRGTPGFLNSSESLLAAGLLQMAISDLGVPGVAFLARDDGDLRPLRADGDLVLVDGELAGPEFYNSHGWGKLYFCEVNIIASPVF